MYALLLGLWRYRGFVLSSIRNEFISRFSRSRLGGLWMIINPLAQVAIYAVILSGILSAKLPGLDGQYAYAIYLIAGILAWSLFSEILSRCLMVFIDNGNLMKKMQFPRITLPVIAIGSSLLNYLLLLCAILFVYLLLRHPLSFALIWLLPVTLILIAFAVGIGLVLGVLNVFIRDVGQVVPILLQLGFWVTPIVYPLQIIPERLQAIIYYNPMYHLVTAYHQILLFQQPPDLKVLIFLGVTGALFMLLGAFMFRRASAEMVDLL